MGAALVLSRLAATPQWASLGASLHEALVTLCQALGLSYVEVGALVLVAGAFAAFDFVSSFADDDYVESWLWALLAWTAAAFVGVYLGVDLAHLFVIAGGASSPTFARDLYDTLLFNTLAIVRVFVCWVRFVFYDLQAEQLDLAFQHSAFVNSHALAPAFELGATLAGPTHAGGVWASLGAGLLGLAALALDAASWLILAAVTLFKYALALYIYWLLVDVTLARLYAHSEAAPRWLGLRHRRPSKR